MNPNTDLLKRLQMVECQDSTYRPDIYPMVFDRAKGSMVYDVEGRPYVDLCAGFGALPLGHGSEALLAVCQEFTGSSCPPVEHAMGDVYPSKEKILFLETLKAQLTPHYEVGSLALGGGQAVEIALKTAMLATSHCGFIVFDGAYHGVDLGVLPLTARQDFSQYFRTWLPQNQIRRLPYGCSATELRAAIDDLARAGGVAGVVVEPIQGRAGVKVPSEDWLPMVASTIHDAGGLVILDEIFTGFGRTGTLSIAADVDADLSCFGKAIGGGFPVSACFGKKSIMAAWPLTRGEAIHTGTFYGHPFSAAVGRRTIEAIQNQNLSERATTLGALATNYLRDELTSNAVEVRGRGLMIGIEFEEKGFAAVLMDQLRGHGVIALPSGESGRVLSITPALNIPEDQLMDALLSIVKLVQSLPRPSKNPR